MVDNFILTLFHGTTNRFHGKRFFRQTSRSRIAGDRSMRQDTKAEFDVAIIGAGISGLTAAALLSKAGLNLVVLEKEERLGGYLAGFTRNGFVFDTAVQWLSQCDKGGFVYSILRHLGDDFPRCRRLSRIRRHKSETLDYLLTDHPEGFMNRLIEEYPDQAEGIRRFFADTRVLSDRFVEFSDLMRSHHTMGWGEKISYGVRMLRWVLPVYKHLKISAEQGLARYFSDENLMRVFCTEDSMMAVMTPIAWAYSGDFQAPPPGGSQSMIAWLAKQAEENHAVILRGRHVRRVLVEANRAAGVELSSGERLKATYVLAACDVEALYERMLPAGCIPAKLRSHLHDADLYYSAFSVFIGLDCPAELLGLGEEMVMITRDGLARSEHCSGDPEKTCLTVLAPSVRDGSLAPAGKGTLSIHCPAFMDRDNQWETGENRQRRAAYRSYKADFAALLIDRVSDVLIPDLRQHVEFLSIATPVTYWRYTGNRDGSIMGARPTPMNIKNRLAHYRTPLKNLYLGGHWAEYGGGIPIAVKAATNASLLILREANPEGFRALKTVLDHSSSA